MSTKTSNFNYDLVENYYLNNLLENNFWIFGSRSQREQVTTSLSANREYIDILDKTVFGIELTVLDFSFMIRSDIWSAGTIYDKYDDIVELENLNFYVIVEPEVESGQYEVFKCISNNYGRPSEVKPIANSSINEIGGLYNLSDGYTWKYMTSIPFQLFRKFTTRGFVPIARNQQVENLAVDGLDFIEVSNVNTNTGYQKLEGTINSQSGTGIYLLNISNFFEAINAYRDSILYVESQETGVIVYDILASRAVGQLLEVTLNGDIFTDFGQGEIINIQVLPKVVILGNGTGALAIPTFNANISRINGIRILDNGQGYTKAKATVVTPRYFSQIDADITEVAILRPIIGPEGGHGFNILKELRAETLGISGSISAINTNITDTGLYTTLALVKNPEFDESFTNSTFDNRLKLELSGTNPTGNLVVGDVVTQIQGNETLQGIIHEIEGTDVIYLVDYVGPHTAQFDESFVITVRSSIFNINSIEESDYVEGSGDVLFISDFLPVERTSDKTEQIKIIVAF